MRNIVECKKAKIMLSMEGEKILELNWNEKEMEKHRKVANGQCEDSDSEDEENIEQNHYDDFNTKQLMQMIISVMDNYRISQESYRNLRAVSQGHLPSLNRILKEHNIMSEEIKYTIHSMVLLQKYT